MISVALCTYNGEKYITQQLESIANQTTHVDEIVVCDDCSTDNTIQLVYDFSKRHPEIKTIIIENETNIGVRLNFEKALNTCNGDIKFLSDQDDVWFPNKVETIVTYFENNKDITVVFSNATLIDSENNQLTKYTFFECNGLDNYGLNLFDKGYQLNIFITGSRACGATMAIRKDVVCNFNYPTQLYHDYILALEAILNNSLGYITTPLMQYRIHDKQKVGLGDSYLAPPKINIYDIGHDDFKGYDCSLELQNELDMRDMRYSFFIMGLRGIPKILINYRKYKRNYKTEWKDFMRADIDRIIVKYRSNHKKIE